MADQAGRVPAFPDDPMALTEVGHLGGVTGAVLVQDQFGQRFMRKRGVPLEHRVEEFARGMSPEHLREEYAAERAYRAGGATVPDSRLYETDSGPVKLAKFVEGTTLGRLSGKARWKAGVAVRKHFVLDALLGNRNVVGAENILIAAWTGVLYRVNVAGSLRFRTMGGLKLDWGSRVTELDGLRDPTINPIAARVFRALTPADLQQQIARLLERRSAIVEAVPEELRSVLNARIDDLAQRLDDTDTGTTKTSEEHVAEVGRPFFHGGFAGLRVGEKILPPAVTGITIRTPEQQARQRADRIYFTTGIEVAMLFAKLRGGGDVYRIKPSAIESDPLTADVARGVIFMAPSAEIVAVEARGLRLTERDFSEALSLLFVGTIARARGLT